MSWISVDTHDHRCYGCCHSPALHASPSKHSNETDFADAEDDPDDLGAELLDDRFGIATEILCHSSALRLAHVPPNDH